MLVVSAITSSMTGGWGLLFTISFSTGLWKASTQLAGIKFKTKEKTGFFM